MTTCIECGAPKKSNKGDKCTGCCVRFRSPQILPDNFYRGNKIKRNDSERKKLLEKQGFKCAICKKPLSEASGKVDHDHKTRIIRGVLCGSCNSALGLLGDNPKTIQRACNYLKRHNRLYKE